MKLNRKFFCSNMYNDTEEEDRCQHQQSSQSQARLTCCACVQTAGVNCLSTMRSIATGAYRAGESIVKPTTENVKDVTNIRSPMSDPSGRNSVCSALKTPEQLPIRLVQDVKAPKKKIGYKLRVDTNCVSHVMRSPERKLSESDLPTPKHSLTPSSVHPPRRSYPQNPRSNLKKKQLQRQKHSHRFSC